MPDRTCRVEVEDAVDAWAWVGEAIAHPAVARTIHAQAPSPQDVFVGNQGDRRDMTAILRPEDNFRNMATAAGIRTSALMDIVVSLVAVPLLIIFSILLESNMRGDWTNNEDLRWNVFGLGLALLFVSLGVCCYVIHRLGMCFWKSQSNLGPRGLLTRQTEDATTAASSSADSQLNLVASRELPPSYDSVVDLSSPPSYFNVVLQGEMKTEHDKIPTVSQLVHDR